jgi:tetratricopeptide (TPR) repeat protein
MQTALLAYNLGNYAQAVAAYQQAALLMPAGIDPLLKLEYDRLLLRAQAALERAVARRVTRGAELDRLMRAGNAALLARNYGDAITAFTRALRLDPDNLAARNALSRARYNKAINDGQRALAMRRKTDAIDAFTIALEAVPGDPVATTGLRRANMLR